MEKPAEILLFDFLSGAIAAAVPGDLLFELELHDTVHQKIQTLKGVRISDAVGTLAPEPGGGLKEYDVIIDLACFAKVEGKEKTQRQPAVVAVYELQREICQLLYDYPELGDRVCDTYVGKGMRGYDVFDGNPYAVANISLVINPSGELDL